MPSLNRQVIGKAYPPFTMEVESHRSIYFALATNDPNPHYTDGSLGSAHIAPPMFAVVYGGGVMPEILLDEDIGDGFYMHLVHGEQEITWHRLPKPGQTCTTTSTVTQIEDKGSGELLTVRSETLRTKDQAPVCTQVLRFFVRGYGSLEKKHKDTTPHPNNKPEELLFSVQESVLPGQPFIYAEASGDHNPIHTDNEFATQMGLDGIILQGLCTMSFCHKALVQQLCNGNPHPITQCNVRFSKPVRPKDNLRIEAWWINQDSQQVGFQALNAQNRPVIQNGFAQLGTLAQD
ncbi:MAG: MaoC/PaaZ C-terminal domain-containing protein [Myxococcota bacterium]